MLAPVSTKKVRKVIKRHRREFSECPRATLLRSILAEQPKVVPLFPTEADRARTAFINAGLAYCLTRCGGCPLTDELSPRA